jgi:hypothetical protein
MKECAYCGHKNEDVALRCADCGTSEFACSNPTAGQEETAQEEVLVPGRPKLVIVMGMWMIYGLGLIGNAAVLLAVLTGSISGVAAFFGFWVSIGGGALCIYLLRRVVKNYSIQKKRAAEEAHVQRTV